MVRRISTTAHCFGFYPTLANWDGATFELHLTKEQAFEFAAVLLGAAQQAKPTQTIKATLHRKQKQTTGLFPIQVHPSTLSQSK